MNKAFTSAGAAILCLALAACASIRTVVADFQIQGSGTLMDQDAGGKTVETSGLVPLPLDPRRASPFPDLQYEGGMLSLRLSVASLLINGVAINKTDTPMLLRFDRATVGSNFSSEELPLKVYSASMDKQLMHVPKGAAAGTPPSLRILPGESVHFLLVPAFAGLYPNRKLFNVAFDGNNPALVEEGVGNTFRLRVPVEHGARRYHLLVDMKALQSHARPSYF